MRELNALREEFKNQRAHLDYESDEDDLDDDDVTDDALDEEVNEAVDPTFDVLISL